MVESIGLVVAPATLLTALLFYFGWVFTNARSLYFGLDPSLLGFSTQDYLLRSVDAVFLPLGALLALALLFLWIHSAIWHWLVSERRKGLLKLVGYGIVTAGLVLLVIGISGVAKRPLFAVTLLITPLSLAIGIVAVAYGVFVVRALRPRSSSQSRASTAPRWLGQTYKMIITILVIIHLFWAMGDWAQSLGRGRAETLAYSLASRPGVIVYSQRDLAVAPAAGVSVDRIRSKGSAYRFRYSGLRLLVKSGGKYFLVPAGWSRLRGGVIALPDTNSVRLEFVAH